MVNGGAYFLRGNTTTVFEHPGKNAFYEEMIWMLWQVTNARAE